mgnify:CR=1 FL=1
MDVHVNIMDSAGIRSKYQNFWIITIEMKGTLHWLSVCSSIPERLCSAASTLWNAPELYILYMYTLFDWSECIDYYYTEARECIEFTVWNIENHRNTVEFTESELHQRGVNSSQKLVQRSTSKSWSKSASKFNIYRTNIDWTIRLHYFVTSVLCIGLTGKAIMAYSTKSHEQNKLWRAGEQLGLD